MRLTPKKIKQLSTMQEKRTAKELGGRVQPGSGNKDGAKGDGITGRVTTGLNSSDFLFENKFTFNAKFPLKLETWDKVANEALRENMRTPLMQIDLAMESPIYVKLVVMDYNDFITFGFEDHFNVSHRRRRTASKSLLLHALEIKNQMDIVTMYREDIYFSLKKRRLVLISLEDFKYVLGLK